MDQFACVYGKQGHVVKLDCRSMEYDYFPLSMDDYQLVLFDTGVKHSLAGSEYNTRREECEEGVRIIARGDKHIKSLRDCTLDMLENVAHNMKKTVYDRCHYVIEENLRVERAAEKLKAKEISAVGELMYASHNGLRGEYEVSCPELDLLVELTLSESGVIGSRMMGGGFGGCTINIVEKSQVEAVVSRISKGYNSKFNCTPQAHVVSLEEGVKIISKP